MEEIGVSLVKELGGIRQRGWTARLYLMCPRRSRWQKVNVCWPCPHFQGEKKDPLGHFIRCNFG